MNSREPLRATNQDNETSSYMRTIEEQGALGERLVAEALKSLPPSYHAVNDLVLRMRNGSTTQIDHLVVSPFGVFVIEAKKYQGTLVAAKDNRTWFQIIGQRIRPFQSPVCQNQYHIQALVHQIPLVATVYRPVTVFIGPPKLLMPEPIEGVITSIASGVPNLLRYIRTFTLRILSDQQVDTAIQRLRALKIAGLSNTDHVNALQAAGQMRASVARGHSAPIV